MGNRDSSTEDEDVESGRVPTSVELMSSSNATDSSHVEIVTSNQQPGLSVIIFISNAQQFSKLIRYCNAPQLGASKTMSSAKIC